MIFSLEVLQAKHGDCLILHFGTKKKRRFMVIDGGPSGVYRNFLKPRLLEIKDEVSPDEPLPLSMVMVSHMDDDHVNGILAMANDAANAITKKLPPTFKFTNFWFNSFDDIVGNFQISRIASLPASASAVNVNNIPGLEGADEDRKAIIASTGQGRKLRDQVRDILKAVVNEPFTAARGKAKLVRGDGEDSTATIDGVEVTVVHPNKLRLEEYQKKWDEDLKKAKKKGDESIIIASLVDEDKSPFNLASIVCLLKAGKKTMLLTGDSRCDDMLKGMTENGLLKEGKGLHVNILKLPHHGSDKNALDEFYERVTADHYVVSADGKHNNPDMPLLEMLAANLKKGTVHFTNKKGEKGLEKKMNAFEALLVQNKSKLKVEYREPADTSFFIHLAETV